jgi:hypothetical protein
MVRSVAIVIGPLVSVMVEQDSEESKAMMKPDSALATAARSDPEPESAQLVTISVPAADTGAGRATTERAVKVRMQAAAGNRSHDLGLRFRTSAQVLMAVPPEFSSFLNGKGSRCSRTSS